MSDAAERRLLDPEAHLLLVEDDGEMRNLVARLLREAAFPRFHRARRARDVEVLNSPAGQPDLILLDVMLPARQASICSAACASVRACRADADRAGGGDDRVLGLELGADDYVVEALPRRGSWWRASAPCCAARRRTEAQPTSVRAGSPSPAGCSTPRDASSRPPKASPSISQGGVRPADRVPRTPARVLSREQLLGGREAACRLGSLRQDRRCPGEPPAPQDRTRGE